VEAAPQYLEDEEDMQTDSARIAETAEEVRRLLQRLNRSSMEPATPADISPSIVLDLSILISIRSSHETQRAKQAVRRHAKDEPDEDTDSETGEDVETRRRSQAVMQAGQRFETILREVNKPSDGTGLSRLFHWTGSLPGGNAQNALLAANDKARRVSHT
jgi:hypothetical protein